MSTLSGSLVLAIGCKPITRDCQLPSSPRSPTIHGVVVNASTGLGAMRNPGGLRHCLRGRSSGLIDLVLLEIDYGLQPHIH